jgi:transcription elongation factor SPT6
VTYALRYLLIDIYEVLFVWTHRRDYLSYLDSQDVRSRVELLTLSELRQIYTLGLKYRSLFGTAETSYQRLVVEDEYHENKIRQQSNSVEVIADATEWLVMKSKDKKSNNSDFRFDDDDELPTPRKRKMPSRLCI